MKMRKRQSVFTLIELLIAAVTLLVVTVLVSGILTNVLGSYTRYSYSQKLVRESNQVLTTIEAAVAQANSLDVIRTADAPLVTGMPSDALLLAVVPSPNSEGNGTYITTSSTPTKQDTLLFCVQNQITGTSVTGKQIMEFRAVNQVLAVPGGLAPVPGCTAAKLKTYFGAASLTSYTLTDTVIETTELNFWKADLDGVATATPPGIRIELVTKYNQDNFGAGGISQTRAADANTVSPQLVLRTLAVRNPNSIGFTK